MAVPQEVDCLVIGGGVSGLTTAFYADKGGAKVCIHLCVSGCLVLCVSPIFPYFLVLTPLSRPIFFSLYLSFNFEFFYLNALEIFINYVFVNTFLTIDTTL